MPAIPPDLTTKLSAALTRSAAFDSNASLRAVFTDRRLYPWRDRVPETAGNRQQRIQELIEFLAKQIDAYNQNVLALFLRILAEPIDPGDGLRGDLEGLAEALTAAWNADLAHPGPLDLDALPAPGLLPPGSRLPFGRNAIFTGREAPLKALARTVFVGGHDGATLITQAIQGMGGVGKTQLAVEFAYRYGRFCRGVHWINAAQPDMIGAEVAECGRVLGLAPWPETLPEQVQMTLAAFARGNDSPRLVCLDNFEDVPAARAWLPRLAQTGARVLLTARRAAWPPDMGLRAHRLDAFTPEESRAYLRQRLPEPRAPLRDLDALAERLCHLPLALDLAARYLAARPRLTAPDYLDALSGVFDHPSMRGWREELQSPTAHDLDLARTFALSWMQVEDAAAQQLFQAAGYCAPNTPIPYALLEQVLDADAAACDDALTLLTDLGLLTLTQPDIGPDIHPLLAEYARTLRVGEAPTRDEEAPTILARVADALAWKAKAALDAGLPAAFAPWRVHVETVAQWAEANGVEDAGVLWNNLGYHLNMIADYSGARAAYERALRIDEAAFGPDHPSVATDVNNLGAVLKDLGDLAGARAACERALRLDEAAFGPDHPNVARDVNNLGNVLKDLGDLAGARAAFERALRLDEAAFGPDHPNVAIRVNNLGLALKDLGDLAGARAAFKRALRIGEAAFGPDHPQVAIFVNNLGGVLWTLGDLAGARAAFERALGIDEAAFSPDHPNVARDVNNLGLVLQDLGDLAGARAAFERALRILRQCLPPEHPHIRIIEGNLRALGPE